MTVVANFLGILSIFFMVIYGACMLFIFLYNVWQGYLVYLYLQVKKTHYPEKNTENDHKTNHQDWQMVTVQLPVFNEKYVIKRLLMQVAALNYPKNKLEIQLLDDSTDETTEIAAAVVAQLQAQGTDIQHIRRSHRTGYKAGALAYGLAACKGDFIAIFDADFLPNPDFLLQIMPHFEQKNVGMVQARWAHLNQNHSALTRLQAFFLDAHFTVEHIGRKQGGGFINFNGSGGVWRKACITSAGGWSADTLTEDLDLSYRAQLEGWRFEYLPQVPAPAELPIDINALKSQQHRWNKGAAECVRKNLAKVLTDNKLSIKTKLHAFFHLCNSTIFIALFVGAMCSLPLCILQYYVPFVGIFLRCTSVFFIGFLLLAMFFWQSARHQNTGFLWFLVQFIGFLTVSLGLSLYNTFAVMQGYLGIKTPFVRTPKFNDITHKNGQRNQYLSKIFPYFAVLELLFAVYFLVGFGLCAYFHSYALLFFYGMLAVGLGYVGTQSLVQFYSTYQNKPSFKSIFTSALV
jgi:cellulose synthase/poly-beta-1,6-N-acetylglucosamine synthase-like glycosyltransferase